MQFFTLIVLLVTSNCLCQDFKYDICVGKIELCQGDMSTSIKSTKLEIVSKFFDGPFNNGVIHGPDRTEVSIKFFNEGGEYKKEFERYEVLGALVPFSSPYTGPAYEAGIAGVFGRGIFTPENLQFIGMKYLEMNLHNYCRSFEIGYEEWRQIGFQMLTSIGFVHDKGFVHGNITPYSFMVEKHNPSSDKKSPKLFLTDFAGSWIRSQVRRGEELRQTETTFLSIVEHGILERDAKDVLQAMSTRSDIESCMYSFMELQSDLPWKKTCEDMFKLPRSRDSAKTFQYHNYNVVTAKMIFPNRAKRDLERARFPKELAELVKETLMFANGSESKFQDIKTIIAAWGPPSIDSGANQGQTPVVFNTVAETEKIETDNTTNSTTNNPITQNEAVSTTSPSIIDNEIDNSSPSTNKTPVSGSVAKNNETETDKTTNNSTTHTKPLPRRNDKENDQSSSNDKQSPITSSVADTEKIEKDKTTNNTTNKTITQNKTESTTSPNINDKENNQSSSNPQQTPICSSVAETKGIKTDKTTNSANNSTTQNETLPPTLLSKIDNENNNSKTETPIQKSNHTKINQYTINGKTNLIPQKSARNDKSIAAKLERIVTRMGTLIAEPIKREAAAAA